MGGNAYEVADWKSVGWECGGFGRGRGTRDLVCGRAWMHQMHRLAHGILTPY